jgi:hypothetical protein
MLASCDQVVDVQGRVTDRQDGTPIVAAVVTFHGSAFPDSGSRISTDSLGRFHAFEITGPGARLDSFTVTAAEYPIAVFRPPVRTKIPTLEVQLAKRLYNEPSRLLVELDQRPKE